jgi:hypothetical protein
VSFTLEIHPSGGRIPLGRFAAPFPRWTDLDPAKRMNHRLALLTAGAALLRSACGEAGGPDAAPTP